MVILSALTYVFGIFQVNARKGQLLRKGCGMDGFNVDAAP
jgi:hypothetical protein